MKRSMILMILLVTLGLTVRVFAAETPTYTPPRFPSYVKVPKSIEDVLPYARGALRSLEIRALMLRLAIPTILIGPVEDAERCHRQRNLTAKSA